MTGNKCRQWMLWALRSPLWIQPSHPPAGSYCLPPALHVQFNHSSVSLGMRTCPSLEIGFAQVPGLWTAVAETCVQAWRQKERPRRAMPYTATKICLANLWIWLQKLSVNLNWCPRCWNVIISALDYKDVSCVCLNFSKENPFNERSGKWQWP